MSNKTNNIKKRMALLLLSMFLIMNMCACGASGEPSGKYYSEEFGKEVYYDFVDDSTCHLVIESQSMQVKYKYVINEEDVGEVVDDEGTTHTTYVVHITDVSSNASHKLVYDSTEDIIYDLDFGLFSK